MTGSTFLLEVATPERVIFSGQVKSIVAPGTEGYFGVLARHAPLVAALDVGELKVTLEDDSEKFLALSGGFLEVSNNVCSVLGDSAELTQEIDLERARQARDRALERLTGKKEGLDITRAQLALEKALNRLKVAGS